MPPIACCKKPQPFTGTLRLCACELLFRLIPNHYSLNHAILAGARVINPDTLTRRERRCDRVTGGILDSRGRAERETDRPLGTIDHNRLARLICCYNTGSISRGRFFGRWLCRGLLLDLLSPCLCERQWRDHRANKDDSYSSHGVPFH